MGMNDEEVIEILDDFEDKTIRIEPIKNVSIGIKEPVVSVNNQTINTEPLGTNNVTPSLAGSNLRVSNSEQSTPKQEMYTPVKNLEEVKYEPIKPEKEEINIDTRDGEEESKSGLGFVIVVFILLAAFIIALPYISKLF